MRKQIIINNLSVCVLIDIKRLFVNRDHTITQVLELINKAPHYNLPSGIAIVVDDSDSMLGMVTDGDIRRALLQGSNLDDKINSVMNTNPITLNNNLTSNEKSIMLDKKLNELYKNKTHKTDIKNILILDDANHVIDVIDYSHIMNKNNLKSISVIGLGYVGLTLAVSLADVGFKVIGIDSNEEIIKKLNDGLPHIHEVGLDSLLKFHLGKNLIIQSNSKSVSTDVHILCVQTPIDDDNEPITQYLEKATEYIAKNLSKNDLIIVRSTVPIGTTRNIIIPILENISGLSSGQDFHLACAPERTVAGRALKEIRELPQIVAGFDSFSSDFATSIFKKLTQTIVNVEHLEEAELIKLMDNTFRDLTFAYSNQIAQIADKYDLNASKIIQAANEGYSRNSIPKPSPGVGGVCLKKDPYILVSSSKKKGYVPKLTEVARHINENMPNYIISKIERFSKSSGKDLSQMKIFVIGFAFKGNPETSDTRQSSTLDVTNKLRQLTTNIFGYDPVLNQNAFQQFNVMPVDLETGFKNADCVLIMNNHSSYSNFDIYHFLSKTNKPSLFFDGWGIFGKKVIQQIDHVLYETI